MLNVYIQSVGVYLLPFNSTIDVESLKFELKILFKNIHFDHHTQNEFTFLTNKHKIYLNLQVVLFLNADLNCILLFTSSP